MPNQKLSLLQQLNTALIKDPESNYDPVRVTVSKSIAIDGSTDTPVDIDLADVVAQVPSSPVASMSVLEIVLGWAAATVNLSTFANLAALTTGIVIKIVKNGVTATIGTVKTLNDFFDLFDEVTITSDTEATPNHRLKARMLFTEQDGLFQHLVAAGDQFVCLVTDDMQTLTLGTINTHGYGFISTN